MACPEYYVMKSLKGKKRHAVWYDPATEQIGLTFCNRNAQGWAIEDEEDEIECSRCKRFIDASE